MNALHNAACMGSTERTLAVLSRGAIDIDGGDHEGVTPLMFASLGGYARIVRILLSKGADVSLAADDSFTALLASADGGHVPVTKLLLNAGADVHEMTSSGDTSLHLAAGRGHTEVMEVVIEAGANPNSRRLDGSTALLLAAYRGHMAAVKVLLREGANPLLTGTNEAGAPCIPLDLAAQQGQSHVVSELIRELGIEGCGGVDRGVRALMLAAESKHVGIDSMLLTSAGVVDTGWALNAAAGRGSEASVRLLLQHKGTAAGKRAYVNTRDNLDTTPMMYAISFAGRSSVRIVRWLLDAGADTSSICPVRNYAGVVVYNTPLTHTERLLREKKIFIGKDFTEGKLRRLDAIRRLLLRVEAVHAISWLWANVAAGGASKTRAALILLTSTLPILRRRARRPGTVLAPLFRWVMRR